MLGERGGQLLVRELEPPCFPPCHGLLPLARAGGCLRPPPATAEDRCNVSSWAHVIVGTLVADDFSAPHRRCSWLAKKCRLARRGGSCGNHSACDCESRPLNRWAPRKRALSHAKSKTWAPCAAVKSGEVLLRPCNQVMTSRGRRTPCWRGRSQRAQGDAFRRGRAFTRRERPPSRDGLDGAPEARAQLRLRANWRGGGLPRATSSHACAPVARSKQLQPASRAVLAAV